MPIDSHDVLPALIGGGLIGAAASALLLLNGRIAGISGILAGLIAPRRAETGWRLAFVLGLVAGGGVLLFAYPAAFPTASPAPGPWSFGRLAVAGVLVGVGTRIGNGCTSGHGVCGLARRSPRSLAATLTFMAAGALAVFVARHLLGWSLA
jgi:uncharacterized membrane protein YedE/YeeE